MAEYRAYIVGQDGHFLRSVDLVCPNDDSAVEYAKQLVDGHDVGLWQGARQIASFGSLDETNVLRGSILARAKVAASRPIVDD